MRKLSRFTFKLFDLMVIFAMVFGSPLSAAYALTDSPERAATGQVGEVIKIMPPAPARELVAFPIDALGGEQSPQLKVWNAPALDDAGNADIVYDVGCMEEEAGFDLQCTANDISIATATNIVILDDGCAYPGDTVTFRADFQVLLTAQARHDVGLWFATDGDPNGDGARTGSCSAATPAYAPDPPWLDLDGTLDPYPGTNDPSGVQDTCGDIDDGHNPLYPSVELTVACVDDDANGKLDLPNCTSWRQPGDNDLCTSPQDAVPGAPSKCNCDIGFNVDIPVPGQIIVDKVTDPSGDPTSFDFTVTGAPTGGDPITPVTFSLTDGSEPFESSYLYAGTYSVVETANSSYSTTATCDDGSPASAIDLQPGEIVTCTFTNKLLTGTLIVEKNLVNDNLGPLTCPDFSYTVDGGTAIAFESDCSNSRTVMAGAHTVVEVGVPIDGYTTTYNNCTNVNVPAGGSATCTITNNDIAVPGMTVEKSSTTTSLSAPGIVTYDYLVTNTGNVTLTGISLSDNNDNDDMVCESDTLAPAATMTCSATHTFTQAELDAGGTLDNIVTADSNETEPITDTLSIPITKNAALTVEKSSTTTSLSAPGIVTYDYLVTNTGNVTLTGISLSDNNDNDDIVCESDTLAPADTMICSATHTFTQAELDANGSPTADSGFLHNVVTASSNEAPDATDFLDIPISQNASMMVEKSSATTSLFAPATVTYDYLVTNTGNTTLTGIVLSDNNDNDDMNCPATTLAVSGTMTCHATHTFTQAELDAGGSLYNIVTASSNEAPDATDDLSIPITQSAALSLVKSGTFDAGADGYANVGELISYEFLVTNEGNVTLTGITVTDPMVDPISCPADTLAVGESMTCTGAYAVTQDDIDAGSVYNMATADSDESGPDDDDETVTLPENPALTLDKTGTFDAGADGYATVGELITYTFVVNNTGNVTLHNVTVTDLLAGLSAITCDATTILVGGFITCTATYPVSQADIDAGSVYNLATADSDESGPDDDEETVPLPQNPALTLDKSGTFDAGADGDANVGELISYEFLVTNTGNVSLTGVAVTDSLGITVTCPKDTLTVGESMTCTASYAVTQADIDAGFVYNLGTADSTESEPASDPNTETLPQTAALSIVKTGAWVDVDVDGFADAGEVINYTFAVKNEGNVTLTNVTVTDPKVIVVGGPTTLDVGETDTTTFTGTYTLTQADVDAGKVDNTATADSAESEPDTDDETVTLPQNPALTLEKSGTFNAGADGYASVGELISYEFLVTNAGNVTLTGITVTDPKVSPISCPADTLAVGESMTCTGSYAVTQVDIDAGFVYNLATADSNESEPDDGDNTEPLPQNPKLSIDKTGTFDAGLDGFADVGELIYYTFVVTNTGNVTLHNVSVTDPLAGLSTITCDATTILVGGFITCTATYAVSQVDIDAGSAYNMATADSDESGPDDDDNNEPLPQNPVISLVKTGTFDAGDDGYANVGELIFYEFLVTNEGNVTLTSITVTDPMVSNISCPADTLAVGESITCTGTYAVTQADIDAGSVYNLATADSDESGPDDDDETVTLPQNPLLSINKVAAETSYDEVDDVLNYTITATNVGNVTLAAVTVTDPLVSDLNCTPANGSALAPGEAMTCTATHTVTQADIDAGNWANTACVDDGELGAPEVCNDEDVPADQNPAISIVKSLASYDDSDLSGDISNGDGLWYQFLVTNTGNVTLDPVSVTDDTFGIAVTCSVTVLAPDDFTTCTADAAHIVTLAEANTGEVFNEATASGTDPNGVPTTDTDDLTTPVVQHPAISIVKSLANYDDNDTSADISNGDGLWYQFLVTNTGDVTLDPVSVTDDTFAIAVTCLDTALDPGDAVTCTADAAHIVTLAEANAGEVFNEATASGTDPNDVPTTATDDLTTPVVQHPAISIVKTTNDMDGGKFLVGNPITWKYAVKNIGDVTLSNVIVTDDILGDVCTVSSLDPGASTTCTKTGTAALGEYKNTGTATADDPIGNDITASDDSSYFGADPEIDVEKFVSIDGGVTWIDADGATGPYLNTGTAPQFKFVVTNTGNVALSTVTVTDSDFTLPAGCIASTLAVGTSDDCTITGTWAAGQHNNKATASGSFTDDNDATETDTDTDDANYFGADPKIDLTKTGAWVDGNANGYADAGENINYSFVVKNTGNVTLSSVTVTDPKVSPISCPKTTLAVNESMTCTGSYTLTLADIYTGKVDNTATASGSFTDDNNTTRTVTDPASATVTLPLAPTGQILPTQTTCQQFRDGTYQTMQQYYPPNGYVYYMLKGRLINNINPGVFFYYSKVTLAGGTFSIDITQGNDKNWPKIPTQVGDNIVLWDAACVKVQNLTAAYDPATGSATISGSVPAGVYYISVKWQPSTTYNSATFNGLVGYAPTGKPIVTYSFHAYLEDTYYNGPIASSGASQIIAPKK